MTAAGERMEAPLVLPPRHEGAIVVVGPPSSKDAAALVERYPLRRIVTRLLMLVRLELAEVAAPR